MQLWEDPNYTYPQYYYAQALQCLARMLANYCGCIVHYDGQTVLAIMLEAFEYCGATDQANLEKFFSEYIDAHLTELYQDDFFGPEDKLDNPSKAHMLAAACNVFYCNPRGDVFEALQEFAINNR